MAPHDAGEEETVRRSVIVEVPIHMPKVGSIEIDKLVVWGLIVIAISDQLLNAVSFIRTGHFTVSSIVHDIAIGFIGFMGNEIKRQVSAQNVQNLNVPADKVEHA